MVDLLKELCLIDGISGREDKVREYIISEIKDKCKYETDPLGNVIAFKEGKNRAKKKVMLSAHMDEVGFIVTYICDNGFLKFTNVGGVDSKVTLGKSVKVGENGVNGVIGSKAIHLCHGDEEKNAPSLDKLYIDIGAENREEAERYVQIGDSVHFSSDFVAFGKSKIKAKAIDDRFGCAIMLEMIKSELEFDTYFAFLVQEEVGCRGASAAAFSVKPDYAIVLEATTAADVAFVGDADTVCVQGKGAVVSFMDRSTIYNRDMFRGAFKLAAENSIAIQTKTTVAGGNDAGAIHKSNGGIYTIAISLPCRYIHSATSVADTKDMKACYNLAVLLAENYAQDKIS
ncbi:MAG: M42 family metallopeptidase [Ruminococcaceae bacterium]|nr:M42 family metallopeptidase [Oscillospiraceae bacterium]